jgi:hypothetical protein
MPGRKNCQEEEVGRNAIEPPRRQVAKVGNAKKK